jgi:hypothetical protein
MPEFTCKICCYQTTRKLNLDRHLVSKKHKDMLVKEAEKQIINEENVEEQTEIQILKKKIELYELELKAKNEQLQKQQEAIIDIDTGIGQSTDKYFNSLKDIVSIDNFKKEMPSYVTDKVLSIENIVQENEYQYMFNNEGYMFCSSYSMYNCYVEFFREALRGISKKRRPFYVSDVKRKRMYIYTDNKWSLLHKEEMPSFFITLSKYISKHIFSCIYNLDKHCNQLPTDKKKLFPYYDPKSNSINKHLCFESLRYMYASPLESIQKLAKQLEMIVLHYCSKENEFDDSMPEGSSKDDVTYKEYECQNEE